MKGGGMDIAAQKKTSVGFMHKRIRREMILDWGSPAFAGPDGERARLGLCRSLAPACREAKGRAV